MTAIYVHIPFCIKKCRYCDFCSVPLNSYADGYCDALKKELSLRRGILDADEPIESIFFGGGTPTILAADHLAGVLNEIKRLYNVALDAEISIECNPKTASCSELLTLNRAGFNRLSVGLQSADDRILEVIGRAHTFSDFIDTIRWARTAGFDNINVDVMHGLPMQTIEQYTDTLKKVCDLDVEHVSAYSLILEDGTELKRMVKAKKILLPNEDYTADMQDAGMAFLRDRGYVRYEVSNFAKLGYECRYNLTYWNNRPYLGVGVAAHLSLPDKNVWNRFSNTESIPTYLRKIESGRAAQAELIRLNRMEQMFETVMLGLRKIEGVNKSDFFNRFEVNIDELYKDAIETVAGYGWWEDDKDFLRLNERGMDMLNSVLINFR